LVEHFLNRNRSWAVVDAIIRLSYQMFESFAVTNARMMVLFASSIY